MIRSIDYLLLTFDFANDTFARVGRKRKLTKVFVGDGRNKAENRFLSFPCFLFCLDDREKNTGL